MESIISPEEARHDYIINLTENKKIAKLVSKFNKAITEYGIYYIPCFDYPEDVYKLFMNKLKKEGYEIKNDEDGFPYVSLDVDPELIDV
jgi:hypothetical protein